MWMDQHQNPSSVKANSSEQVSPIDCIWAWGGVSIPLLRGTAQAESQISHLFSQNLFFPPTPTFEFGDLQKGWKTFQSIKQPQFKFLTKQPDRFQVLNRNIFQKVMKEDVLDPLQWKCQDTCLLASTGNLWWQVAQDHVCHKLREEAPPRDSYHTALATAHCPGHQFGVVRI